MTVASTLPSTQEPEVALVITGGPLSRSAEDRVSQIHSSTTSTLSLIMTTPYGSLAAGSSGQTPYGTTATPIASTPSTFTSVLSSGPESQPSTPTPARGRPRGSGTGAKRGRKPKGAVVAGAASPRPFAANSTVSSPATSTPASFPQAAAQQNLGQIAQSARVHFDIPGQESIPGQSLGGEDAATIAGSSLQAGPIIDPALVALAAMPPAPGTPRLDGPAGINLAARSAPNPAAGLGRQGADDDVEVDDEALPAMADDDYSAQLSWQSQSKDNLKVLMDNLSSAQYDRFEAYRRQGLPKQGVRKVIQQTLGHQVSMPVAQIIAGFSKVFVGEIVEKARSVQARRGDIGPLSPDHLREAYRMYQAEAGRVGAARPLRSKKLFVR